jgi:hypothetical protein
MVILFVLFVVIGFAAMLASTWGGPSYMTRIAWGSWLIASLLWAIPQLPLH